MTAMVLMSAINKHAAFNEIPSFLNPQLTNWKAKDLLMCCLVNTIDECGAMVEW